MDCQSRSGVGVDVWQLDMAPNNQPPPFDADDDVPLDGVGGTSGGSRVMELEGLQGMDDVGRVVAI